MRILNTLFVKAEQGYVRYIIAAGLSTETKPTEGIATGSVFYEVNTGDEYMYNEASGTWVKQPSSGGGSGSITDVQIDGTTIVSDGVANIESDDLDFVTTVSGTTPSITGVSGMRYICGECSTLTITTPSSGIVDVIFESGSTPTVLTVTPPTGMTMMWANDFDPTSLEADTVYEISILDGIYGVVGTWS